MSDQDAVRVEKCNWGSLGEEVEKYINDIADADELPEGTAKKWMDKLWTKCIKKKAEVLKMLKNDPFDCAWCEWEGKSIFMEGCLNLFRLQGCMFDSSDNAEVKEKRRGEHSTTTGQAAKRTRTGWKVDKTGRKKGAMVKAQLATGTGRPAGTRAAAKARRPAVKMG
jgi:hypothetical protein